MADVNNGSDKTNSDRFQDVDVNTDEELQDLLHGEMVILQKKNGYRFSVDPILLTSFIELKKGDQVIDLGTGSGIMPLILASRQVEAKAGFVGVEVQKTMADMAERSVTANHLGKKIDIRHSDIRDIKKSFAADSFDVVISNPPYVAAGTGRVNPEDEKAVARHEIKITLEEVVIAARYLIKPKGRAYFVFPVKRLTALFCLCRAHSLEPRQVQFVHANHSSGAKLAMLEAQRDAGVSLHVNRPMFVYNMDGTYTEEVAVILNEHDFLETTTET
ncbi:MAG: tRNA1(Val) (adenine(37)-N6)-methyltransferase [Candidatus Lernaella stagnicola]|nr:tRNA1(Val) (adenine(37)-N6)-methyltransferase [Candidatus Lernaella stagnicola]